MGNRFYVEPRTLRLSDLLSLGTKLGEMREKQALTARETEMQNKNYDLKERTFFENQEQNRITNAREDKKVNISQGQFDLQKEAAFTTTPITKTDWTQRKLTIQRQFVDERGMDPKFVESALSRYDSMNDANVLTPRSGLVAFTVHGKEDLAPLLQSEQKKLDKMVNTDGYSATSLEVTKVIQNIEALQSNKLSQAIFPRAYSAEMQNENASQRKIAEQKAGKDQYGALQKDQYGNLLQSSDTGKLTKVSGPTATTEPRALKTWVNEEGKTINLPNNVNPPEGYTPYDQSSKIEERQNKIQEIGIIKQTMGNINRRLNAITKDASLKGDDGKPLYPDLKTEIDSLKDEKAGQVDRLKELLGKTTTKTTETTKATEEAGSPPVNLLKEGIQTTFKNGQVWTLRGGKAVRIK